MRATVQRLPWPAVSLLLPLLAGGCGADPNSFAPTCPKGTILSDAGDITRLRVGGPGTGRDVTDQVLTGRITRIDGKCMAGKDPAHIRASVTVSLTLSRGPAMAGRQADVTYFVAVTRGQTILDKAEFTVHGSFPPNIDELRITGEPVDMVLPTPKGVTGPDYTITTGFQLTPQELAANRARLSAGATP